MKRTPEARFWAMVEKGNACWLFQGALNNKGYGKFYFQGRLCGAHRVAWALQFGALPDQHVCHRCDTPACVNPAHLFLGSQRDNLRDMASKGRHWQQKKTHCPQGHLYTPENTRFTKGDRGRMCVTCHRAWRPQAKASA